LLPQRASEQFSVLKQTGGGANSREEMLKEMAAAFDKYMELNAHLQVSSILCSCAALHCDKKRSNAGSIKFAAVDKNRVVFLAFSLQGQIIIIQQGV